MNRKERRADQARTRGAAKVAVGTSTQVMIDAASDQLRARARAKMHEGTPLAQLAALLMEEERGKLAVLVDRVDVVLSQLRDVEPPPRSTIATFDEPAQEGLLRVVTMSLSEGWATHWVLLDSLSPGGEA